MELKRGRKPKSENGGSSEDRQTEGNTGTGTGTDTNTNPNRIENDEVLEVNLVGAEIPEVPQAKGKRGRPAGSKNNKQHQANNSGLSPDDIKPLLMTFFGLLSIKAGEVWAISEAEADSIAKPLVRIFEKMNVADKVANMSDGAGLTLALIMIIAPRVMATIATKETKKEKILKEQGGTNVDKQSGDTQKNISGNIREMPRRDTANVSGDGGYIKTLSNATIAGY